MTAIIPGTGATITSDTAEQQLIDVIAKIKNLEKLPSKNPNNVSGISCSFNLGTGLAAISFNIPANPAINPNGQIIQVAAPYLTATEFAVGTDGTFKSISIEGYFLEVVAYLEIMETNNTKNPSGNNYVSSSFDSDARLVTGTITLPFVFSNQAGYIDIVADEYLLD